MTIMNSERCAEVFLSISQVHIAQVRLGASFSMQTEIGLLSAFKKHLPQYKLSLFGFMSVEEGTRSLGSGFYMPRLARQSSKRRGRSRERHLCLLRTGPIKPAFTVNA